MSSTTKLTRRKILSGAAFIALPPVVFFIGAAIWAALTYDGICPGIMDIEAYPCTIWEFIGRNTISPFAFAAHLGICVGWVSLASVVLTTIFGLRWLIGKVQSAP